MGFSPFGWMRGGIAIDDEELMVTSTSSLGGQTTWTINTETYTTPTRVFYHPARPGPKWKNTSQRVTRNRLSRYTKA